MRPAGLVQRLTLGGQRSGGHGGVTWVEIICCILLERSQAVGAPAVGGLGSEGSEGAVCF